MLEKIKNFFSKSKEITMKLLEKIKKLISEPTGITMKLTFYSDWSVNSTEIVDKQGDIVGELNQQRFRLINFNIFYTTSPTYNMFSVKLMLFGIGLEPTYVRILDKELLEEVSKERG